jgi:type II restriction/modification system DNA methylase subunit YeeA
LTEEEKNAQAQANKENEENDDLKVVMPEANRTTMPQEEFKEQPDYLKVFANFYIAEFDEDDLEVINLYDENHNMVDINRYVLNNIHFPRKKLVDHVLQYHDYNFKDLLKTMEEKTGVKPEEMLTYEAWEKWDEDQRTKIPSSLS